MSDSSFTRARTWGNIYIYTRPRIICCYLFSCVQDHARRCDAKWGWAPLIKRPPQKPKPRATGTTKARCAQWVKHLSFAGFENGNVLGTKHKSNIWFKPLARAQTDLNQVSVLRTSKSSNEHNKRFHEPNRNLYQKWENKTPIKVRNEIDRCFQNPWQWAQSGRKQDLNPGFVKL